MAFLKKYGWVFAIPILSFLAGLLAVRIVNSIDWRNNDFFTFWLAGHLVVQGGNPYDPAQWVAAHHQFNVTWIPNQAFVYPLPLSLFYIPFGLLSLKTAYIVWVALSELMMVAALLLLVFWEGDKQRRKFLIPLLLGLVFFRPATLTLVNGQISAAMLLLLAATVFLWERGKWEWGSLLLPLLMLKPNLGAPILVLLGLWLLVRGRYRSLLVILGGSLALLVIGLIQNPHWVGQYWAIGNLKVSQNLGGAPNLWGIGYLVCRHGASCTQRFGGAASVLLVLAFAWLVVLRWKYIPPFRLIALAAIAALLVTPYLWTYDQLLILLPVVDLTLWLDKKGLSFVLNALFFLGVDVLMAVLLLFDTPLKVEIFNAVIPLLLLGLYAVLRLPAIQTAKALRRQGES